ncbi:hypothetical protein jhhlp_005991 [Lomentospora prolificans]|uniref:Rhodanese domain-containing protein n=1 Tax=Lomentospora prolificans TaxID=41688 RepID=A0A2N3N4N3_9PEZI|nr:hypothetical protein jhhlp_005991 [Lomentospora prolificans]
MASIANLQRITAKSLSDLILAEAEVSDPSYAVIDVRDDDHIGGHIKGSMNVPSRTIDAMMPTLLRKLESKQTVVFHCALSQQRGPSAALRYLREVERLKSERSLSSSEAEAEATAEVEAASDAIQKAKDRGQKVYVLDRGFVGWQELYGEDERLTSGYRKDLWKNGYWG